MKMQTGLVLCALPLLLTGCATNENEKLIGAYSEILCFQKDKMADIREINENSGDPEYQEKAEQIAEEIEQKKEDVANTYEFENFASLARILESKLETNPDLKEQIANAALEDCEFTESVLDLETDGSTTDSENSAESTEDSE
jgi:uncharacterized protein YwgA